MYPEADQFEIEPIEIPKVRRSPWAVVKMIAALTLLGGAAWAWHAGYRPANLFGQTKSPIRFVEIDSGDVDIVVVENGTIESANNATVRCQVEALIGLVGGTGATTGTGRGTTGSTSGQGSSAAGGSSAQGGASGAGGTTGTGTSGSTTKAKTTAKAGSSSTSNTGTTGSSGASTASTSSSGSSKSSTSTLGFINRLWYFEYVRRFDDSILQAGDPQLLVYGRCPYAPATRYAEGGRHDGDQEADPRRNGRRWWW